MTTALPQTRSVMSGAGRVRRYVGHAVAGGACGGGEDGDGDAVLHRFQGWDSEIGAFVAIIAERTAGEIGRRCALGHGR
ncbi:hypothetical protein [Pseudorhodobacter ferrugineus]|uniref:hypothetical protein n=1 Tax=Pseudorhodobacter ferrugineus TaxID=77008 RepID=UPI0003B4CFE6|nr:hypothetical protein [Pseudorhodobacter ferrugineus]